MHIVRAVRSITPSCCSIASSNDNVVSDGIIVFGGISVVDAINFGGFQQPVRQFRSSKRCTGVGGEEGVAVPAARTKIRPFSKCRIAIPDERLGDRRNGQGGSSIVTGVPSARGLHGGPAHSARCPACPCNRRSPEQSDLLGQSAPTDDVAPATTTARSTLSEALAISLAMTVRRSESMPKPLGRQKILQRFSGQLGWGQTYGTVEPQ